LNFLSLRATLERAGGRVDLCSLLHLDSSDFGASAKRARTFRGALAQAGRLGRIRPTLCRTTGTD